jgi:hypothetical protein
MTDLRELLRETRGWLACVEPINEPVVNALKAKIDAALAQPPDAEPFCWICEDDERILHDEGSCTVYEQEQETKILPPYRQRPLYTDPQPPAGKGVVQAKCSECGKQSTPDSMWALYCLDCCESIRAHSAKDAVRAEPMQRQPIQDSSASGAASIPREIHERLIAEHEERAKWWQSVAGSNHDRAEAAERALAEAKQDAERYRWLSENCIIETDLFRHDGKDPASTKHPLDNAIDAAIVSEHERGE